MINIRTATQTDVSAIVAIHQSAFKDFFLTSLGSRFLTTYYSCFIKSGETVALCAEEDGSLLGFSAATSVSKRFNSRLIKTNAMRFSVLAVKMLFTNPAALVRLVKNFTKTSDEVDDTEDYGELFSIGVSSNCQGKGIGKKLLTTTESMMCKTQRGGVKRLSLTTDYYNNDSAIGFYKSCGYKVLYEFTAYPNRRMLRMIKDLE